MILTVTQMMTLTVTQLMTLLTTVMTRDVILTAVTDWLDETSVTTHLPSSLLATCTIEPTLRR